MNDNIGMMFDETVVGVWFVELPVGDWMACMNTQLDGSLRFIARFRYYNSADAWDGKDEKRWMAGTINAEVGIDAAVAKFSAMAEGLRDLTEDPEVRGNPRHMLHAAMPPGRRFRHYRLLRSEHPTFEAFAKEFMAQPWVHAKEAPPEQAERIKAKLKP